MNKINQFILAFVMAWSLVVETAAATTGAVRVNFDTTGTNTISSGVIVSGASRDQLSANGVTVSGATASTVPYLDASKKITSSAVTPTELGRLSGVTGDIQAGLDGKQPLDADLTAIAALTTTAFGIGLLDDADESAAQASLGLVIGTDVQAWDADLDDLADGSLSGSKVGSGIDAGNVTTGTLDDARIPSAVARDTELAGTQTGSHASPDATNPLSPTWAVAMHTVWYGATGTINLPAAAGYSGRGILIYNTGAFTVTVDANGTEVIVRDGTVQSGGVSITISSGAGNYVALLSDGTRWITLGYKGTLAEGS